MLATLIAMAGLAEAVEAIASMIAYGVFVLVAIAACLCWFRRSRIAGATAVFLCVLLGLWLQPWRLIAAVPTISPTDPDELHWISVWRSIAIIWIGCSVGSVLSLSLVIRGHRLHIRRAENA